MVDETPKTTVASSYDDSSHKHNDAGTSVVKKSPMSDKESVRKATEFVDKES